MYETNNVVVSLRRMGMMDSGLEGREIIAKAVGYLSENPDIAYMELIERLEKEFTKPYGQRYSARRDFECNIKGLKDVELNMLFAIETIEYHEMDDDGIKADGRAIIQEFIQRVYDKCSGGYIYEKLTEIRKELLLDPNEVGINLLLSMAYKLAIICKIADQQQITDLVIPMEVYEYIFRKCETEKLDEIIEKEPPSGRSNKQIKADVMKKIILEAARECNEFKETNSIEEIIEYFLNRTILKLR